MGDSGTVAERAARPPGGRRAPCTLPAGRGSASRGSIGKLLPCPARSRFTLHHSPEQIAQIVKAARRLRESYPLRRQTYSTLLGLIAATGLRISEALDLRLSDILPEGVLRIQRTKFNKTRLVPLHLTVIEVLNQYLIARCKLAVIDDHVFLSAEGRRIHHSIVNKTFRRILQFASIVPGNRHPRIHDLRHTFVTRALEKCATQQKVVSRHFAALATYVGHADIADTYWYLAAAPELMAGIRRVPGSGCPGTGLADPGHPHETPRANLGAAPNYRRNTGSP